MKIKFKQHVTDIINYLNESEPKRDKANDELVSEFRKLRERIIKTERRLIAVNKRLNELE